MKNPTKILAIGVILLLLVNIAMIVMMVRGRERREGKRGKGGPMEMMQKELNMTDQQKDEFRQLRDENFKNIRPLLDSVRSAKSAYFNLIKDSTVNDSVLNVYSQRIASTQAALDKATFDHFRKARSLFSGEQQKKFDELVQRMMQRGPGGKKRDSTDKDR